MFADIQTWKLWLWAATAVAAGVAGGLLARRILFSTLQRFSATRHVRVDDLLVLALRGPAALILPAFGVQLALTAAPIDGPLKNFLRQALALVLIAAVGWVAISLIGAGGQMIARRYGRADRTAFAKRSLETRVLLVSRLASTAVAVITGAIMLMTIPAVRELGTSILASAGIAGIVAGLAAQSVLRNLFAGVQLALTEPVRIGDSVVIEKEYGTVEEIGSSFVVVRLWDLRRLIVPLNYFFENHFQNWTFRTSDLVGSVILYVDYQAPVELLRTELLRIVEASPRWDRKTAVLQVTDVTAQAVEIRALVSASEASQLWELRCEVREKMLDFLRQTCPKGLPRVRYETLAAIEPPQSRDVRD